MNSSGAIVFGVKKLWVATQVTSAKTYNDGQWHQAAASFGSGGMALYVDGVPVGSVPGQTVAEDYAGYWRVGGDSGYLWPVTFFTGAIDDFSVYPTELTPAQVADHWAASGHAPVNPGSPTAAFTTNVTDLHVAADGSGSSDSDGTVTGYSWKWGDGTPDSTGATPSHDYAAAGTYTVTLTVTDNDGNTGVVTHSVKVGNVKPTASFTATPTGLSVAVDASASTDSDGSIASYSWDWGDGTAVGSGKTASHTFAPGPYTITLTVTDNLGATDTTTRSGTVTNPSANVLASDDFNRTTASGWGSATKGGAWTIGTKAQYSVAPGAGNINIATSGRPTADLKSLSVTNTDTTAEFSVDKLIDATYVGINGREVGAEFYNSRIRIAANGTVQLYVLRTSTAVGAAYTVPGMVIVPGTHYKLRFQVNGTSPTTLSAKVWKASDPEPAAWQISRNDTLSPAIPALQGPGYVGLYTYIPSGGPINTTFYSYLVTDGA